MAGRYPNPRRKNRRPQRRNRRPGKRRAPVARKAMIQSRRPLVELKLNSAVNHTYQALSENVTVIVPDAWMVMQQGFDENQMIGKSLLTRYINHKMFLSFSNSDTISYNPNIRVIAGWYMTPPNDVPHVESVTGSTKMGLYSYNPELVIKSAITNMLDNPLGTIDKKIFKVQKDFLIKGTPRTAYVSGYETSSFLREGRLIRHSWKPNKKIHYLPASEATTGAFTHLSPAGAPKQWVPFICLYFGNNAAFPTGSKPTYILENHHYFTDS